VKYPQQKDNGSEETPKEEKGKVEVGNMTSGRRNILVCNGALL
jgi:hypothetical protein